MSALLTGAIFALSIASAFDIPPNDGFMTDATGILRGKDDESLEETLAAYHKETGGEIAVAIIAELQGTDIADAAWAIQKAWGMQKRGSGILLLLARKEGKILIAPGEAYRELLTDPVLQGITEKDVLPPLRNGEYVEAIRGGIRALEHHIAGTYGVKRYEKASGMLPEFSRWWIGLPLLAGLGMLYLLKGLSGRRSRYRRA